MMTGKEKLYFLLKRINDVRAIAPSSQPLMIDPMNDLYGNYRDVELSQLFTKLEKDEKVLQVLKAPSRTNTALDEFDPYEHADDGCWHIKLLPAFDRYFLKIQQEPEYQEFTGKKPANRSITPNNNSSVTYQEKLKEVISKLRDERDLTRKDHKTKVTFDDGSFASVRIREVCKILLKLQDDEGVVKILDALQPLETVPTEQIINPSDNDDYEGVEVITVELGEEFDNWFENYLMGQKTDLENIDYINMLRIYDVVLDINEQVQLTNKTTVSIHLLPSLIRFNILFPGDTIGMRDKYCESRWDSLKYLKGKGAIDDFKHNEGLHRWQTTVSVSLKLSKFDEFYQKIRDEYIKRNKSSDNKEEKPEIPTKIDRTAKDDVVWPDDFRWEGKDFILGKYGNINFTSDDRKYIFKILTDKKGGWATISELKGNKDAGYVRSTIKQIEDRLPEKAKGHIKIVSTQDDDTREKPNTGAYRIKVLS